ncbi:chemoreceptor glutamine deamidase CheD [Luteibacter yeojuensis]|uniref:Probable chemoreceptor glutamine deamidase CheD n=1 Tax=Luteibacter yeojuensis TaxID=345309 RepID=A0A0F3K7G3_9GAMM|nr:chemoreceptor glutamine deamidase CheD [Luteibacter yeojuensis]KJV27210.1 chemotaxis protein CheD [Luteibacter yeojuensis]
MSDTFVAQPRTFAGFDPKRVLPGFEHLRRFWDPAQEVVTVKILPGEFYVSTQEEMISTVLGSCVSACVRDTRRRIGGMNHFMLPEPASTERDSWGSTVGRAARYGNDAMEQLINSILKAGGRRDDLEVKIFGGGRVLQTMTDIGQRNIAFVQRYIATENLKLCAADVGDIYPRHVHFFPVSGKVRVRQLRATHDTQLADREKRYLKRLENDPIKGEVELF